MIEGELGRAFLASAECAASSVSCADPSALLAERTAAHRSAVHEVRLDTLDRWHLGTSLHHDTDRFFTIEGVSVATNFGPTRRWTQPLIVQPEVGMLGFLAKRFDGVLHVLAQAKMEPGNRAVVQFSPTVQATPSNYSRVHGGRRTPYLEYFVGATRGRVLVDQLQSEQGSRYYRKRNRNIVVEVPEDHDVAVDADFCWLTLGQIRALLGRGNSVNLNARTVLSCIAYGGGAAGAESSDDFRRAVLDSHRAPRAADEARAARTWLTDVKTDMTLDVRRIPLGALDEWICDGESIRHASGRFFRVLGVSVSAGSREVDSWAQPMVSPTRDGYIVFLCQRRDGVLHWLVQARVEPGFIDNVELGATLQLSPGNYARREDLPPFADYLTADESWVRMRTIQSEDGGRFYHDEKHHVVIEVPEGESVDVPPNYRWMTIAAIKQLMRTGYHVAVEARSLVACLG